MLFLRANYGRFADLTVKLTKIAKRKERGTSPAIYKGLLFMFHDRIVSRSLHVGIAQRRYDASGETGHAG